MYYIMPKLSVIIRGSNSGDRTPEGVIKGKICD